MTYKLSTVEGKMVQYFGEEGKYGEKRSFPQSVIRVTPKDLVVKALWTSRPERTAQKAQCRRIAAFVADALRKQVQQLYPRAPWVQQRMTQGGKGVIRTTR